jgi:hypothetical protein
MPRKSARDGYDAQVELEPVEKSGLPSYAYALVKITYAIANGRATVTTPEPLRFDLWHDETLDPRLPVGSDFWPHKLATDVVIEGSACSPDAKPRSSMEVQVSIGRMVKRIAVFGRREVTWSPAGRPRVQAPEPFVEMPLIYANAYGGLDPRVPIPEPERQDYLALAEQGLAFDHPGSYPRNLAGKGYLVLPEPIQGLEMPNLENPRDLLTAERLVVRSPELWYRQPLPWCFDRADPMMFPRLLFLGVDTWFPCHDPRLLPEVQAGYLSREILASVRTQDELHPGYFQEASFGMVVREPLAGQPVVLTGMNPEASAVSFSIPPDPTIEFNLEGRLTPSEPRISNLVMRPRERTVSIVYCAKVPLPRVFIPEVHKTIPVSIRVNNDRSLAFDTPPTIRDRLQAALKV